ncbi:MAG: PIG-L family deacetylase [Gammaproteobacteria bacterium]
MLNATSYERVIVLSPHLDDAILSAACLLRALSSHLPCLVVTLAAANPADHRVRHHITLPIHRRQEDFAALRFVGCTPVHLAFEDAIYRQDPNGEHIYHSFEDIFAEPDPRDSAHQHALLQTLERITHRLGSTLLIAPLSIGHHVDHIICAQAALQLRSPDTHLWLYEDFPYVVDKGSRLGLNETPQSAATRLGCHLRVHQDVPVDIGWKWQALSYYASQLSLLFADEAAGKACLMQHRNEHGPIERFWSIA